MPVYKDPNSEWLWNELCSITQRKYNSNTLAFAWMVGFLITTIIELMHNDSAVKTHVIRKLKKHKGPKPGSLSNKQ